MKIPYFFTVHFLWTELISCLNFNWNHHYLGLHVCLETFVAFFCLIDSEPVEHHAWSIFLWCAVYCSFRHSEPNFDLCCWRYWDCSHATTTIRRWVPYSVWSHNTMASRHFHPHGHAYSRAPINTCKCPNGPMLRSRISGFDRTYQCHSRWIPGPVKTCTPLASRLGLRSTTESIIGCLFLWDQLLIV